MSPDFSRLAFSPADILLPQNCEYDKWSVVACDQYTSQPEYWQRVEEYVGGAPSSLRLILPESCLDGPNAETDVVDVNNTMTRYLREDRFRLLPDSLLYVERRLDNLRLRRGLIGKIDLEQFDYENGLEGQVRATEGIQAARLSARIAARKNAPLELSHVMLLVDDPEKSVIEPLAEGKGRMERLYDFDLMERGGHIAAWRLDEAQTAGVADALRALHSRSLAADPSGFLFAVGDGNYSLATAKECYERQKKLTAPEHWEELPARYALVELVNLRDAALELEPVHRVAVGVEPRVLLDAMLAALPGAYLGEGEGHMFRFLYADGRGAVTVPHPAHRLVVGTLQSFLEEYLSLHGGRIRYIHGSDAARALAGRPGNLAFLLPAVEKDQLFPAVLQGGALPLKSFTLGAAHDKRFYLEARKIRA